MKASKELQKMLVEAIEREMQVSIQYLWQHIAVSGPASPAIADIFKKIAIVEMKHAEEIAERLDFFGGKPPLMPKMPVIGNKLEEMLKVDIKAEEEAVELYRKIIDKADAEKDIITRKLFEKILADEEEHLYQFQTLLGE